MEETAESGIDKYRLRRIGTSYFRGWQIYVETLLDSGAYKVKGTQEGEFFCSDFEFWTFSLLVLLKY